MTETLRDKSPAAMAANAKAARQSKDWAVAKWAAAEQRLGGEREEWLWAHIAWAWAHAADAWDQGAHAGNVVAENMPYAAQVHGTYPGGALAYAQVLWACALARVAEGQAAEAWAIAAGAWTVEVMALGLPAEAEYPRGDGFPAEPA